MSVKGRFAYTATIDTVRAAEYLTRLAEGLMAGTICLTAAREHLDLSPSDIVRVDIHADNNLEKGKGSLIVELFWKATTETPQGDLDISTTAHEEASPNEPAHEEPVATVPMAAE